MFPRASYRRERVPPGSTAVTVAAIVVGGEDPERAPSVTEREARGTTRSPRCHRGGKARAIAAGLSMIVVHGAVVSDKAVGGTAFSDGAYGLLHQRMTVERTSFYVYRDADSGSNHGFPSGLFGVTGKITLDTSCIDEVGSVGGCSTDANRLDAARGTALRISFAPLSPGQFAGVNFEEPEHWGAQPRGQGYDLRGATELVFDVRTTSAQGVSLEFGVGGPGHTTGFIPITHEWTTKRIPLSSLNVSAGDLANVHILFSVGANDAHAPAGATVLLDNVRFEPMPASRQAAVQFPLANQTFGVVPRASPAPGRVSFPLDQVLLEHAVSVHRGTRRPGRNDLGHPR